MIADQVHTDEFYSKGKKDKKKLIILDLKTHVLRVCIFILCSFLYMAMY